MATHPTQNLIETVKAALVADDTVGAIGHVFTLLDADWIPPDAEFPVIGLLDGGTEIEHGPGQAETMLVDVAVYQEIALDQADAPSVFGYGTVSPGIGEKGVLEIHADIRAVLNRQSLTGYYQGRLISETRSEMMPARVQTAEGGEVVEVETWAARKVATYEYVAYTDRD